MIGSARGLRSPGEAGAPPPSEPGGVGRDHGLRGLPRLPVGVLAVGWLVPASLGSALLWLIALTLAPPTLGLVSFVTGGVVWVVLACGGLERHSLRLLTRARPTAAAEAAALAPVLVPLAARGLLTLPAESHHGRRTSAGAPGGLLVRAHQRPRSPAVLLGRGQDGRGTLVVAPWLIEALGRGAISVEEAAAIVVHAVGRRRGGHHRFEVALTAWLLPWRAVQILLTVASVRFAWLPLVGAAWRLRWAAGCVAAVQSAYQGRVWGLLAGGLVALSYLVPAARRSWEARLTAAGDRLVAAHGLGHALVRLISRHGQPLPLTRVLQLQHPVIPPTPRLLVDDRDGPGDPCVVIESDSPTALTRPPHLRLVRN